MTYFSRVRSWCYAIVRRSRVEGDMDAELLAHIESYAEDLMRGGISRDEALRRARMEFGGVERVKEECRESRGVHFVESLMQDLRFALRMLRKSPGFTAVAVLTLALGIGANTAIFSVVNGVLLRPLPYADPNGLISIQEQGPGSGNSANYPDFFDWQSQNHSFGSMATYHSSEFTLTGTGQSLHVLALVSSSDLFKVLEAKPQIGRIFESQDDERGHDVVLLSHSLWRGEFHESPVVVGQTISLNNHAFTIIGVMPEGFQFPPNAHKDLWLSMAVDRESKSNIMTGRGYNVLSVIGRLKSGVSLANAQAEMNLIARRLAQQYPESNAKRTRLKLMPELDRIVGSTRELLLLILGAVIGVLLIACVNLANLSLARNLSRHKELAVRAALGAPRARVFRQLLTESILLSFIGGAAGIALAAWGSRELVRFAPENLPRVAQVGMDWRVLLFAAMLSIATGVIFGIAPAMRASRISFVSSLKDGGQNASQGVMHLRLRSGLVIAETALTIVLLIGAGLLISSYERLTHVPLGFNPHSLLTFNFDLPSPPYSMPQAVNFMNQLLPKLRALPGVTTAAADWSLPLSGNGVTTGLDFEGRAHAPGNIPVSIMDAVTPGYFETMGIPLLKGREFTGGDDAKSPAVMIVNEAFARRFFPNENPVGKRVKPSLSTTDGYPLREIVGVVGNTKLENLAESSRPEFYMPFAQIPNFSAVIVRVQGDPLGAASGVRAAIASMDKNVPVYDIETMDGYLSASVAAQRFSTVLLTMFAALGLVLAAIGIYGVVAFSVGQRTREIGIRMALGAHPGRVSQMVLKEALVMAAAGTILGIGAALGLTRFMSSQLFGVTATDPATFVGVTVLLAFVALAACHIPARRAMKVDPMVALRHE